MHTIFVEDCECEELVVSGLCSRVKAETGTPEDSRREEKEKELLEFSPGDPCSTDLTVVMDDYLGSANPVLSGVNAGLCIAFILSPSGPSNPIST